MNNFVILEASAGSGKTHNLAKRYISLLLNFDSSKIRPPLNNILALTFTNKATIEMKERIIKYLKQIALQQDIKDILADVNVQKSKIPANADIAVNNIIENFDHFNVRTIDSFINLIIKACALKLGIAPNYQIIDSYEDYIDYSIDSFLDKSYEDKKIQSVLDGFFEQFLIDSSSWKIRQTICDNLKKMYKKEVTKKIVETNAKTKYSSKMQKFNSDFIKICKDILKVKNIEDLIGIKVKIKDYAENIVCGKKTLSKDGPSPFFSKDQVQYLKAVKENQHSEILENALVKGKKILTEFMKFRAEHYYNNYIKMFDYILKEFDSRSRIDSVMFLQDINKQVSKIFNEKSLTPEIYLSLSSNFTDFLIDEFQDTNQVQWQTLKLIVAENLANNGSFFYVGDKKQAIYGFRGGDYKIFDVPKKEFAMYNPKSKILDTNYRSSKAIVDFNNQLYSKDNIVKLLNYIENDRSLTDSNKYYKEIVKVFENSEQKCNRKESGYVEISYKEYSEKEELDEIIKKYLYTTIDDIHKRFSNKDITIICRKNEEIEKIGKWLLEKNIDIESFQTLNIINSQIIKDLFCALQFFNMPLDNIAFVSFITSNMFLKATSLTKEEVFHFINSISVESKTKVIFYTEFRKKYSQIWKDYIEEFFNRAGFVAVYEMVISIIAKYKIIDNFKDYTNIIYRFLEVICDFEKNNQGLQNFIDYFKDFNKNERNEKFFIKVPSSNAIKITTIHKAKGLEFNVVIMPYFYINQSSDRENLFSVETANEVSFLNINKEMLSYSQYLKDLYYERYFKNVSNELNGLYVSTTRAVYEFYGLILHKDSQKKKDYIEVLINENKRIFGKKESVNVVSKVQDSEIINNIEISSTPIKDIVDIINDSSLEIYGKKHKDILLNGKIIHYALSQIETFNLQNLQTVIDSAVEKTQVKYSNNNISNLKRKLLSLLSDEKISKLFNETNTVFNEKEYVDKFGNTIRADKIIIKSDSVDIVDFKSSIYDKEYINNQMKKYVETIKDIYVGKQVNCYVLDIENVVLHEFNINTGIE